MIFAEVIVDISAEELNRGFTYIIPESLKDQVCVGSLVKIPFGRSSRKGYVVSIGDSCDYDLEKLKEIKEVVTGSETNEARMVQLAAWMSQYYSCNFIQALKTTLPARKKIKARTKKSQLIGMTAENESEDLPTLTPSQEQVYRGILDEWANDDRPCLIHGVTGSGKTLIYMQLISRVLKEGRQVIVLIPEISLTYQTVNRFVERFGDKVAFLNSRMSQGEKYESLKKAKNGETGIMIGPRSALFTPFSNLGLIIIDEEHEESYRSESSPRYHSRETALKRASIEGAHVVMGSATPSLESYDLGMKEIFRLFHLNDRFGSGLSADAQIIDMRQELRNGNGSFMSMRLREEVRDVLRQGRQAMLFLNRRGYAGFVSCRSCGYVFKCPHCDVSMTEHLNGMLTCHYCGFSKKKSDVCPECGSKAVGGMKIGTEQVETYLKKEFEDARILRMDLDTTGGKEGHAKILSQFASGDADILIGTQMIVKGHDYPNVALVGVLMADLSLNDSDYRAAEKTFQLITQAVGRTGRGREAGKAVIQTYDPEHYSIAAASKGDYESFYLQEMFFRKMMKYPPAGNMMAVFGSSADCDLLEKGMEYINSYLKRIDPDDVLEKIGPAPMAVRKIRDVYREALYIRANNHEHLKKAAEKIQQYVDINKGFDDINIQFDFNI